MSGIIPGFDYFNKGKVAGLMEKLQRFSIRLLGVIVILADTFLALTENNRLDATFFMDISFFDAFLILGLILFVFPSILLTIINALEAAGEHFRERK